MTHVTDLYEPGDDREPEPCDWYPALEPVDLEAVAELLKQTTGALSPAGHDLLDKVMPQMVAELREARRRIAEFEALPTREEWVVTGRGEPAPDPLSDAWGGTAEMAADYAAKHRAQAWRRTVHMGAGEPISPDAPF